MTGTGTMIIAGLTVLLILVGLIADAVEVYHPARYQGVYDGNAPRVSGAWPD